MIFLQLVQYRGDMFMTDAHLFQASFFSLSMYEKLRILMVN